MKKKFDFQWIPMPFSCLRAFLFAARCGVRCWMSGMIAVLCISCMGQVMAAKVAFSADDLLVTLVADSSNGRLVYTVMGTLRPEIDFSGYHGLGVTLRLKPVQSGLVLTQHAGNSAFAFTSMDIAVDGDAYVATMEAQSLAAWTSDTQPWVAWSFEVANGDPLGDARIGLVQVDVIEGLRPMGKGDSVTLSQLYLGPNPCTERICVRFQQRGPDWVQVVDLEGHVVRTAQYAGPETCLDLQALPCGTYLLCCILNGERVRSSRFIRE